jgi:Superinfection immunity protein
MTHTVYLTVVMLAVMAIYFLPALIADERKRPDTLMLALFNFALGWTLVGWAMALYWALQPVKQVDGAQLAITTRREKTEALFAAIAQRAKQRDTTHRPGVPDQADTFESAALASGAQANAKTKRTTTQHRALQAGRG